VAHVDPHRARGDAVEHEQAAHLVHRVGHRLQVVVGQHHAGGGLDVRRDTPPPAARRGCVATTSSMRRRREGLLRAGAGAARLQHDLA
jgi:hypothetical protein